MNRKIEVRANYGWPGATRTAVIDIPESEFDEVEEYVYDWVFQDITYSWEDITPKEAENK